MQDIKLAEMPENEYLAKPYQVSTYDCANQFIDVDDQVSIDFFEFELTEAINELSLQTGIAIITDDYLEGLITFKFEGL